MSFEDDRYDTSSHHDVLTTMIRISDDEMAQDVKLETLTGHKFQEFFKDDQKMTRRVYMSKNDFEYKYSRSCPECRSILKDITRQGHSTAGKKNRENEFYQNIFRNEVKKQKFTPAQQLEDDMMDMNDDSAFQSRSDEERKRELE